MAVRPASVARPAPVAGRPLSLRRILEREGAFSWLMLAPAVLFLLAFVAYPFFYGIFVGLANFQTLAHDPVFWQVARNTCTYVVVTTILKLSGGLGMALVINQK